MSLVEVAEIVVRQGHAELAGALSLGSGGWNVLHAGWSARELRQLRRTVPDARFRRVPSCPDGDYGFGDAFPGHPHVLALSYVLSRAEVDWERALATAWRDLPPGGLIGIVDLHEARTPEAHRWLEGLGRRVLPSLPAVARRWFVPLHASIRSQGDWSYAVFVGARACPDAVAR